jgi:hypothetical protein
MGELLTNSFINNYMEYVYRLDLPSLDKVLKNDIIKEIDNSDVPILTINPSMFFSDDILATKSFHWNSGVVFKKPRLYTGPIHVDGDATEFIWGINWVYGGSGGMCYWTGDYKLDLSYDSAERARLNPATNVARQTPDKNYKTMPGSVYLVNASIPHNAYNLSLTENRYAVSIRATDSKLTWDQVVELFSDLII